jgi:hypothetical protein
MSSENRILTSTQTDEFGILGRDRILRNVALYVADHSFRVGCARIDENAQFPVIQGEVPESQGRLGF